MLYSHLTIICIFVVGSSLQDWHKYVLLSDVETASCDDKNEQEEVDEQDEV